MATTNITCRTGQIPVIAFDLITFMYGFGDAGSTREGRRQLACSCSWRPVRSFGDALRLVHRRHQGEPRRHEQRQLEVSFYVWGMMWFIFSEVMFFAAFFGALFYVRNFAVPWLGGEGDKGLHRSVPVERVRGRPWPPREPVALQAGFTGESMAETGIGEWGRLPAVLEHGHPADLGGHGAHRALGLKSENRKQLTLWLAGTVALGFVFLFLQVEEYIHAYRISGLTLDSGIYGSTFFMLTGFHGFHVTLGTFMLAMCLGALLRGHFKPDDHFGFEA